jgi:replicative DNA helicase
MMDVEKAVLFFLLQKEPLPSEFMDPDFFDYFMSRDTKWLAQEYMAYRRKYGVPMSYMAFSERLERRLNTVAVDAEQRINLFNRLEALHSEVAEMPLNGEMNPLFWLENLRLESAQKRMTEVLSTTIDLKQEGKLKEAVAYIQQNMVRVADTISGRTVAKPLSVKDAIPSVWEAFIKRRDNPLSVQGLFTGFVPVDRALGIGLQAKEMLCFVARASRGKSVALNTVIVNAFKAGKKGIVVNKEMARNDAMGRFYSAITCTPYSGIRSGQLSENVQERVRMEKAFRRAMEGLWTMQGDVWFLADSIGDLDRIDNEIQRLIDKTGVAPDYIVLDYLNILQPKETGMNMGRMASHEIQRVIAEQVRGMAEIYNCPVITAAQSNREGAESKTRGRRVETEIIAGSDYIGNTADVVLRIYKDEVDEHNNTLSIDTIKMRQGRTPRTFKMDFDSAITYMSYSPESDVGLGS